VFNFGAEDAMMMPQAALPPHYADAPDAHISFEGCFECIPPPQVPASSPGAERHLPWRLERALSPRRERTPMTRRFT